MAQHFLLSAAARTLKLKDIYKAGEEAAYAKFCALRWTDTGGEPVCPRCGGLDAYRITTRRKFKCKACGHQFSVTSGTIFASRKLSFVDMLAAICIIANAAKGLSALQLSRDVGVQYKTAFVLAHKIREALADETEHVKLAGTIEIDGAYFGGKIRPANLVENRVDRRLAEHQTGKRRVVIALRQRKGRTLTFVRNSEADGVEIARDRIALGSSVMADEASIGIRWMRSFRPRASITVRAIPSTGVCTNQAESFFGRLRRMASGQHHHVSPQYLHQYAAHAAWLEDHRRESNGALANRIVWNAMAAPVSRQWKGYWQR